MKKLDAINNLLTEHSNSKVTKTAYKRCLVSLDVLGLDGESKLAILGRLEFLDNEGNLREILR